VLRPSTGEAIVTQRYEKINNRRTGEKLELKPKIQPVLPPVSRRAQDAAQESWKSALGCAFTVHRPPTSIFRADHPFLLLQCFLLAVLRS